MLMVKLVSSRARMKIIIPAIVCMVCADIVMAQVATPPIGDEKGANEKSVIQTSDNEVLVTSEAAPVKKNPIERTEAWLEKYLSHERRIAGWVDNTARGIDRFFGTDDAWRVDNDSYLRVIDDIRWEQEEGVDHELRPRLKLDLPTASKRLRLLVETDAPEERTAAEDAVPGLRTSEDQRRTTVFGVGTNFDGWFPQWKKKLQGGVRLHLPVDPYVRFVARRDIPLSGKWELNSYNRFSWFNSDGYSAKSALTFGKPIGSDKRLYYSTNLAWREKLDYLEFAQSANITNVLTSRSAITYTLGLTGASFSQPHIDNYFLAASYRKNISREIIFITLAPELNFADAHDFNPRLAFTLRLELYFQQQIERD